MVVKSLLITIASLLGWLFHLFAGHLPEGLKLSGNENPQVKYYIVYSVDIGDFLISSHHALLFLLPGQRLPKFLLLGRVRAVESHHEHFLDIFPVSARIHNRYSHSNTESSEQIHR